MDEMLGFEREIAQPLDFGEVLQRFDGTFVITHGGMPYHVTLTDPKHAQVVEYITANPQSLTKEKTPAPPKLEDVRKSKMAEISNARWEEETGGVEYNGFTMHTDRESQAKYTGAIVAFQTTGEYPAAWKAKDGWLPLDTSDTLMQLAAKIQQHVNICYGKEAMFEQAIKSAKTIKEVEAIKWE